MVVLLGFWVVVVSIVVGNANLAVHTSSIGTPLVGPIEAAFAQITMDNRLFEQSPANTFDSFNAHSNSPSSLCEHTLAVSSLKFLFAPANLFRF